MSSVRSTMRSSNTQAGVFSVFQQLQINRYYSGVVIRCNGMAYFSCRLLLTGTKEHTPTARWQQTQWLQQPVKRRFIGCDWLIVLVSTDCDICLEKKKSNTLSHEFTIWTHLKVPNEKTEHYHNSQQSERNENKQNEAKSIINIRLSIN